jgi:hypothetical protein
LFRYFLFAAFFTAVLVVVDLAAVLFGADFFSEPNSEAQRSSGLTGSLALLMARFATALTIQSKLSLPTEWRSASGAGDGLTCEEIAEVVEKPPATVRSQLRHARKALTEMIDPGG